MQQMEPIKLALFVACDEIKTGALVIRSLLVTHFRTMGDARTLLKTMAKVALCFILITTLYAITF